VSLRVHFRPEGEIDIEDASNWYEKQRKGLGYDFLGEVLTVCETFSENPNMYPAVHRHTRRAVMHRFPFGIYYRIEDKHIVVVAIMHGSRHPKRWKKRT